MKILKNLLLFIFLIISIQISAVIWYNVNIPFHNQEQIIGFYSIKNFNPLNDVLGYLIGEGDNDDRPIVRVDENTVEYVFPQETVVPAGNINLFDNE